MRIGKVVRAHMLVSAFLATAISAGGAPTAQAFGSIGGLDQDLEHEKITRLGLAGFGLGPDTMDEIAGTKGEFGAVGAPDRPDRGLMNEERAHCDSGDTMDVPGYPQSAAAARKAIMACRAFMFRHLENAVVEAGKIATPDGRVRSREIPSTIPCTFSGRSGRAKCNVLEELGLALHTAQDFYAHSNWVDLPASGLITTENPPGLGNSGPAPFIDPVQRGVFPEGLVTGCFEGKPERVLCTYDGGRSRLRHKFLNKDNGPINVRSGAVGRGTTPRGAANDNFRRAVTAAVADTRNKWAWFEASVLRRYGSVQGNAILCGMRNDNENSCR